MLHIQNCDPYFLFCFGIKFETIYTNERQRYEKRRHIQREKKKQIKNDGSLRQNNF
jgi:hypothetical protein